MKFTVVRCLNQNCGKPIPEANQGEHFFCCADCERFYTRKMKRNPHTEVIATILKLSGPVYFPHQDENVQMQRLTDHRQRLREQHGIEVDWDGGLQCGCKECVGKKRRGELECHESDLVVLKVDLPQHGLEAGSVGMLFSIDPKNIEHVEFDSPDDDAGQIKVRWDPELFERYDRVKHK